MAIFDFFKKKAPVTGQIRKSREEWLKILTNGAYPYEDSRINEKFVAALPKEGSFSSGSPYHILIHSSLADIIDRQRSGTGRNLFWFSYAKDEESGQKKWELKYASFFGCDFRKSDFKSADIDNCAFWETDFKGSDFSGSKVYYCYFEDVSFEDCDFTGAQLLQCEFRNVSFKNCKGVGCVIKERYNSQDSHIQQIRITGWSRLLGGSGVHLDLERVTVLYPKEQEEKEPVTLHHVDFRGADFRNATFECYWDFSTFQHTLCDEKTDFRGADFDGWTEFIWINNKKEPKRVHPSFTLARLHRAYTITKDWTPKIEYYSVRKIPSFTPYNFSQPLQNVISLLALPYDPPKPELRANRAFYEELMTHLPDRLALPELVKAVRTAVETTFPYQQYNQVKYLPPKAYEVPGQRPVALSWMPLEEIVSAVVTVLLETGLE